MPKGQKLLSIFLFLTPILIFFFFWNAPYAFALSIGDGNADGQNGINVNDIKAVLTQYLILPGSLTDQYGDSKINTFDFVVVQNRLLTSNNNSLLTNSGFEDGFVNYGGLNDRDPRFWATTEGVTARGTGRVIEEHPSQIRVLCGIDAPITPLEGSCLLKIKSDNGVKAFVAQSYYPTVIDSTFTQEIGVYIPNILDNSSQYFQQLELREGIFPGASNDIIRLIFSSANFQVCDTISANQYCKSFATLKKDVWHRLKITLKKRSPTNENWSLKVENLRGNNVYWDSETGPDTDITLSPVYREYILPQIGTLFFGDECLGSQSTATGCDGIGTIYYDSILAQNLAGTGRFVHTIPADANSDGSIDQTDLDIWKTNYLKIINNQSVAISNATGDFRHDDLIDGKDFATWWNRSGQIIQK